MQVIYNPAQLRETLSTMFDAAIVDAVLIDEFLAESVEVDVDAICDGKETVIAGIMEHIEPAGIHSGDSSCVLPPVNLPIYIREDLSRATAAIARRLSIVGFLNVQFAVREDSVFVLEANPRASRTIPFVSKATGIPWAKIATRVILGERLESLRHLFQSKRSSHFAVKAPVIPFSRFRGACIQLGPEMRSTGEVMGLGRDFGEAFGKAQLASGRHIAEYANVIISASNTQRLELGRCVETLSNAKAQIFFARYCDPSGSLPSREFLQRLIEASSADLVISLCNIDERDEFEQLLRQVAIERGVPLILGVSELNAFVQSADVLNKPDVSVLSLQEYTCHSAELSLTAPAEPGSRGRNTGIQGHNRHHPAISADALRAPQSP
jgi:carbamoyl-phosphate synthase large subunit